MLKEASVLGEFLKVGRTALSISAGTTCNIISLRLAFYTALVCLALTPTLQPRRISCGASEQGEKVNTCIKEFFMKYQPLKYKTFI
jgi:hypothetical protein